MSTEGRAGAIKLLHLDSDATAERAPGERVGSRGTFERLLAGGELRAYESIRFLPEYRRTRDAVPVHRQILERAAAMRPDVIYWQHVSDFPIDQKFIDNLREASRCSLLAYQEGDAFGRFKKPITSSMRAVLRSADIVFAVGLGELANIFREAGARDLRFIPQSFDPLRSGLAWDFSVRRKHKVVMIAGNYPGIIPGFYMPGGRKRAGLARKLNDIYGIEFALYGSGWRKLASARGPLNFDLQESVIRDGWVSVNWGHFDEYPFYCSNRLPISLAAGVPHVTTYHSGYEDMFKGCPGLYFARTVDDAMAKVDWLLSMTQAQLIDEGRGAQEWVAARFSSDITHRNMLKICAEKLADKT